MKTKILLLTLLLSVCSLVAVVQAQEYPWEVWWDPQAMAKFLFPGMTADWLRMPNIIYYLIVPFITAFTVIYGILRELRIFRFAPNKVNILIAFSMAFLLLPSGILTLIVSYFYAFGAFVGLVGFGVVFIVGVLLWGYGTSFRFWEDYGSPAAATRQSHHITSEIHKRQRRIIRLQRDMHNPALGPADIQRINDEIVQLQDEIDTLISQRANIRQGLQVTGTT